MDKDFETLWEEINLTNNNTIDVNKVIANALKEYRMKHNYTVKEFAKILNTDPSIISNLENNRLNLTTKRLQKIIDTFHCKFTFKLYD